jgi:allantoin racemase
MKILYQIPGHMSAGPLGPAELRRRQGILQAWAAPDTTVEVADSPGGPMSIESQVEGILSVAPMTEALLRRPQPPDAVIVGCFGDPGVHALREVLDCPVVGPFEAAMHQGAQLGARVGVVTVLDSVMPMLDELARSMGMSLRYAGAIAIDVPVLELGPDPSDVAARVIHGGERLLERGADVLILGCMSLAFLGIAESAAAAIGIPVINPARCALKTAEAVAAQQLVQSRRTYAKPRKTLHWVKDLR